MKKSIIIFFLFLFSIRVFSQGELDEEKKIFYRNEKTFGFIINSNGWGVNYRFAKRINASEKWIYDGDFNVIKHPKERKSNTYSSPVSRVVYGKLNYVINLRASAGRQRELFRKFDKSSVSVRIFYLTGVTFAFAKPIYYQILQNDGMTIKDQKFDAYVPSFYILGRSQVFKGLFETKVYPGAFVKIGTCFEYSKKDKKFRAIEAGISFDAYYKKIEIMATEKNNMFYPSLYLTFRFGKVVSGYHLKEIYKDE